MTNAKNNKYVNAFTIDVEDGWSIFSRDSLAREMEPTDTVVRDTQWILETLDQKNVRATFFVVGDVAKKFPSLIKQIAQAGHEIGVHSFLHKQIFKLSPKEFRHEISYPKKLLEDICSVNIQGYRAPAFSVMPQTSWAFEILAEEGFAYDSSVMPYGNKRYGWAGFSKDICRIDLPSGQSIIEVPMSALNIPVLRKGFGTGGGYLRHFPYALTKQVVKYLQKQRPAIIYMHPYEFGTETVPLPMDHLGLRDKINITLRLKMAMRNKKTMPGKLTRLLYDFEFTTIQAVIEKNVSLIRTYTLDDLIQVVN